METEKLLEFEEVSFVRDNRQILDRINLSIHAGESWVLLGRNGAGKSTIVNLLYGMAWTSSGTIRLFGETYGRFPIQELRKRIGILEPSQQENAMQKTLTVREVILTGIFHTIGYYRDPGPREEERADKVLKDSEFAGREDQLFTTLSSGEKRKVLFLRALATWPDLLILDEPCASLDLTAREEFLALLRDYRERHEFTSLFITHRPEVIPDFYGHAALLKEGKIIVAGKITEVFTQENLNFLYDLSLHVEQRDGRWVVSPLRG